MTATVPYFAAAVEADANGEPMPAFFRHDLGFGTSDDVAGLIAYLASDAAAGVTGQAIGVGGDRLQVWSHPEPVVTAYRDGGWTLRRARGRLRRASSADTCSRSARSSRRCRKTCSARATPDPSTGSETTMTRYEPAIDLDAIDAIDVHVHIEIDGHGHSSLPDDLVEAASRVLHDRRPAARPRQRRRVLPRAEDGRGRLHRRRRDATSGTPPISSAEIAEGAARNNDVLIPFGSVDPHREDAVDRVRRLIEDHGVRGFKFHPTVQGFDPSDERYYPLYAAIQDAGVAGALPHRADRHRRGPARRARAAARPVEPDAARRRRRGLPRPADHHGAPVGAVAGRGALGRDPQAQHVDRPVRVEPEVLPGRARPLRELDPEEPGAVRLGLPAAHARSLDPGCRADRASSPRSCPAS